MRTKQLAKAGAVTVAAMAILMVVPAESASAETCGDDGTTTLFDPSGNYFDFTEAAATADRDQPFATLYDSGNNGPAGTPPGPRSNSDSFDDWGALFVGGTDVTDMYYSTDNNACSSEDGGAEHVFPVVTLHGLQVQRKIYVHPNAETGGLPGARILNLLTNSGAAPITTSVQVGDNLSADDEGDLGSDGNTAVRSSSSGDLTVAAGDRWFVTSDHQNSAGTENSDPALAFLVDGPGGVSSASAIQLGAGTDSSPEDNLTWSWQVTVQPGETVALMSFVVQADVAVGADQATQADALAASLAQRYQTAPSAQLYAGMSPAEIAALRNWNDLEVKAQVATAKKQKLGKHFKAQVTCPEESCKVSLGATLRVGKKKFALNATQVTAPGGVTTPVQLTLKKKSLKKILALVAAKPKLAKKVKITFAGTATDLTSTATQALTGTSKVKVKKPKN